jgi:succinate-semialdehyde dehydrogenase / glutarate-semialdehyde dehydrogenase
MRSINPFTCEIIKNYKEISENQINQMIAHSMHSFNDWKTTRFTKRSELMLKAASILRDQKNELAQIITDEMGKLKKEALAEIEKCITVCQFYAEKAEDFLKSKDIESDYQISYVAYKPLGPILGIMPWNYPFWQAFRFAAPTIMAGNSILLKHASNVTGCSLAIENIFKEAGFPEHLFQSVILSGKELEPFFKHKGVKAITLTGSTEAGRSMAKNAGKYLKKTVLELGGSDPYLVLADADLDLAATELVKGRLLNAGQSCISPKRIIADKKIFDELAHKILIQLKNIKMGDPNDEKTSLAPLARTDIRNALHEQVLKSLHLGAQNLCPKIELDNNSNFYPPVLLTQIKQGMPAFNEELFGPVFAMFESHSLDESIALANHSEFGLGSGIFTKDLELAEDIANNRLRAGMFVVNGFLKSDPRIPFGGIKNSGYGRELGFMGIKEFVNAKSICIYA